MSNKQSYKDKLDMLEKSSKFPQASALRKMLEEDNQRLFQFIDEGNDFKDIPMNDVGGIEQNIKKDEHFEQIPKDFQKNSQMNDYQPI